MHNEIRKIQASAHIDWYFQVDSSRFLLLFHEAGIRCGSKPTGSWRQSIIGNIRPDRSVMNTKPIICDYRRCTVSHAVPDVKRQNKHFW